MATLAIGAPRLIEIAALAWVPLMVFGLAVVGVCRARRTAAVRLVAATALYFALAGGGTNAGVRFRVPVLPLSAILAGAALGSTASRRPSQPTPEPREESRNA